MSYPLKTDKTIGIFPFEKRGEVLRYTDRHFCLLKTPTTFVVSEQPNVNGGRGPTSQCAMLSTQFSMRCR